MTSRLPTPPTAAWSKSRDATSPVAEGSTPATLTQYRPVSIFVTACVLAPGQGAVRGYQPVASRGASGTLQSCPPLPPGRPRIALCPLSLRRPAPAGPCAPCGPAGPWGPVAPRWQLSWLEVARLQRALLYLFGGHRAAAKFLVADAAGRELDRRIRGAAKRDEQRQRRGYVGIGEPAGDSRSGAIAVDCWTCWTLFLRQLSSYFAPGRAVAETHHRSRRSNPLTCLVCSRRGGLPPRYCVEGLNAVSRLA